MSTLDMSIHGTRMEREEMDPTDYACRVCHGEGVVPAEHDEPVSTMPCDACDGTGHWPAHAVLCTACDGDGDVLDVTAIEDGGSPWKYMVNCERCEGLGWTPGVTA